MKKVFLPLILLISTLMLSSWQVNWFGSYFDVPWYFIAIPVLIVSIVVFIVSYVIILSKTYVCPKCKNEFNPKWHQIYITIHFDDSRIAKCPNCGRKGFCKRKDQWHLFCQHDSKNSESLSFRNFLSKQTKEAWHVINALCALYVIATESRMASRGVGIDDIQCSALIHCLFCAIINKENDQHFQIF